MTRLHRGTSRPAAVALAALLCVGGGLAAQERPPRIDALLGELAGTDADAWRARVAAVEAAAKAARADAAKLREQAAAKTAAADRERRAAKLLAAEIDKLEQVRALLTGLNFRDPAGAKATQPAPDKPATTGGDAGALERTLGELRQLPAAAWQARVGAMRQQIEAHGKAADAMVAEHAKLTARADAQDARAKQLDAEREKLDKLQKLLATLALDVLAKAAPRPEPGAAPAMAASAAATKQATKPAAEKAGDAKNKPAEDEKAAAAAKPKPDPMPKAKGDAKPAPNPGAKGAKAAPAKSEAKTQPAKATPTKPAAKAKAAPAAAAMAPKEQQQPQQPAADAEETLVTYDDHVYPIFDENCVTCHETADPSGGLDLESYATTLQGGSSGRTLTPGDPGQSRLYLLVAHREKPTMPPDEPPIDKQLIETIRTWIAQGAPKDETQAKKLAAERRAARARAAAQAAAAAEPTAGEQEVVMPTELPRVRKHYPERPGPLRTVATSPVAPVLAVPGHGQVLLLHQESLRDLGVLPFAFGQVTRLAFSRDGRRLLAAGGVPGQRGGAQLFDVRTGALVGTFAERRDIVMAAALSPTGDLVAVGDTRKRVEAFRASDGQSLWHTDHDDWVTALEISADGELIASADRAGAVHVREARTGREVHTFAAADGAITDLRFSPDTTMLATAGADRSVDLYRLRDGRRLFEQKAHGDQVLALAWRDTKQLISCGADGRVLRWRTNGSREADLPGPDEWAYGLAVSGDGGRVFVGDWLGRLHVVDAETRKRTQLLTPLSAAQ